MQPAEDIFSLTGHFEVIGYLIKDRGLQSVKGDLAETIKDMVSKVREDGDVIDKDDLKDKFSGEVEILKFLGLE